MVGAGLLIQAFGIERRFTSMFLNKFQKTTIRQRLLSKYHSYTILIKSTNLRLRRLSLSKSLCSIYTSNQTTRFIDYPFNYIMHHQSSLNSTLLHHQSSLNSSLQHHQSSLNSNQNINTCLHSLENQSPLHVCSLYSLIHTNPTTSLKAIKFIASNNNIEIKEDGKNIDLYLSTNGSVELLVEYSVSVMHVKASVYYLNTSYSSISFSLLKRNYAPLEIEWGIPGDFPFADNHFVDCINQIKTLKPSPLKNIGLIQCPFLSPPQTPISLITDTHESPSTALYPSSSLSLKGELY